MSASNELKLTRQVRDLPCADIIVHRGAGDEGPVRMSFPASSEIEVERWWGTEVLQHDAKSVRLDRLNAGAGPVLFNHDWNDPVGMVDSARVKDKRVFVDVHFFDTARAKEVVAMVEGGMRNVSIGYELLEVVEDTKAQKYTATDWRIFEVSFATVPADPSVGVGRSADAEAKPVRVRRADQEQVSTTAAPAANPKESNVDQTTNDAGGAGADTNTETRNQPAQPAQPRQGPSAMDYEKQRTRAITNLCAANKIDDKVRDHWIGAGLSVDAVTEDLLKIIEHRGNTNPQSPSVLGLTESETQRFSLFKAIVATRDSNWTNAGFELECSRAVAKQLGKEVVDPNRFFVPYEVQTRRVQAPMQPIGRRDMTVASASGGGYLVGTENVSFIEMKRNRSVAERMGVRRLPGLRDNVTIPRQTAAATAVWMSSESATLTESAQTLGQITLTPKTVGAYTEISRQLMLQSNPAIEGIVTADLAAVVALAQDVAVLRGSGSSGEPTGIVTTSGIGAVTGTSLDFADILEFQTDVAAANVMPMAGGYVTTPAVASLLIQRVKYTSTASPLWEGNIWDGTMQGFAAMTSNQMSAATMLFGDWNQVLIGEWGVLEVEVNPYANFQSAIIGVRAIYTMDCALRYAGAFSYASSIT